jgi:hypothetical protein
LHNDENMKKIKLQHQQTIHRNIIKKWKKSFKKQQISNIKIIREKTKIEMDKCYGHNNAFYVDTYWKWFFLKSN